MKRYFMIFLALLCAPILTHAQTPILYLAESHTNAATAEEIPAVPDWLKPDAAVENIFLPPPTGGTCPSAAAYINPALLGAANSNGDPQSSANLVTLATLGVSSCYFIAPGGSDSNDGLSEASGHPWQHAPYMPNCSATCLTVKNSLPSGGIGFIFEGGGTWHEFTGSPQIGLPPNWPNGTGSQVNGWDWIKSGTATTPFYIGVDKNWFIGSAWTRPIINSDNPVNPTPTYTPVPGLPQFYYNTTSDPITLNGIVASCAFPQGSLNNLTLDSVQYVILDNFEFTGMCFDGNGSTAQYLQHAGPAPQSSELSYFYNLYFHGYTHLPYQNKGLINANASIAAAGTGYTTSSQVAVNGNSGNNPTLLPIIQITSVGAGGAVTGFNVLYTGTGVPNGTDTTTTVAGTGSGFTLNVTQTSVVWKAGYMMQGCSNACDGDQILYGYFDGSDSDDTVGSSLGIDTSAYIVAYSFFNHLGGTVILDNCHTLHDNLFQYINNSTDAISHGDVYLCEGESPQSNFFYNNLLRYIGTEYNLPLSTIIWWITPSNNTDYVFNNVSHDINCGGNCYNFDDPSSPQTNQHFMAYNNTMESVANDSIWKNQGSLAANYTITTANNHYITEQGTGCAAVWAGNFPTINGGNTSCNGDVFQTHAAAALQGYTSSSDYQSTSGASFGAGANETSFCATFGTDFCSTTSLSIVPNTTNHTLGFPKIAPILRPTSGAWNAGAFGAAVPSAAISFLWSGNVNPTTVALGSSPVTKTSAAQTVTVCNGSISSGGVCTASGATLTITAMGLSGVNSGDFAFTTNPTSGNDCGGSLAAGSTCTVSLTVDPSILGPESATFSVTDSASGSPQSFSVTGTGISQVSVSPASQSFGNIPVTTPSSELLTALTNNGSTTVTSLSLSITGTSASLYVIDTTSSTLGGQTNCAKVTSLAASATCNAGVTFTPVAVGNNFVATLNFSDSASGSPQTVSLTGNGTGTNPVVPNNPSAFAVLHPFKPQ